MKIRTTPNRRKAELLTAALMLPLMGTNPISARDVLEGGRTVSTPQQLSGRTVSTPQQLNRSSAPTQQSRIPGSAHQPVYQRQEYGKPLRQGRSVNGPYGDITIWSAAPSQVYDAPASSKPTIKSNKQATPPTGPKLRYVPDYGKAPEDTR